MKQIIATSVQNYFYLYAVWLLVKLLVIFNYDGIYSGFKYYNPMFPSHFSGIKYLWNSNKISSKIVIVFGLADSDTVDSLSAPWRLYYFLYFFTVQYSQCIWDKDTDEMVWYPEEIDVCNSKLSRTIKVVQKTFFYWFIST